MNRDTWPWSQPAVIVLDAPFAKDVPTRHPCLTCMKPTPISPRGLANLHDLRRLGQVAITVCYRCHQALNLDTTLGEHVELNTSQFRAYKGLDR